MGTPPLNPLVDQTLMAKIGKPGTNPLVVWCPVSSLPDHLFKQWLLKQ
jgi:hypothetical protein